MSKTNTTPAPTISPRPVAMSDAVIRVQKKEIPGGAHTWVASFKAVFYGPNSEPIEDELRCFGGTEADALAIAERVRAEYSASTIGVKTKDEEIAERLTTPIYLGVPQHVGVASIEETVADTCVCMDGWKKRRGPKPKPRTQYHDAYARRRTAYHLLVGLPAKSKKGTEERHKKGNSTRESIGAIAKERLRHAKSQADLIRRIRRVQREKEKHVSDAKTIRRTLHELGIVVRKKQTEVCT